MKILQKYISEAGRLDQEAANGRAQLEAMPSEREALLAGKTGLEQIDDKTERKLRDLDLRKELLPRLIAQREQEAEGFRDKARGRILMVAHELRGELEKVHLKRWEERFLAVLVPAYDGSEGEARACLNDFKGRLPVFVTLQTWLTALSLIPTQVVNESGIDAAVRQLDELWGTVKASPWAR